MAVVCGSAATARRGMLVCASTGTRPPNIKVIVTGACKNIGKAAITAISKARGMEVAGAIDTVSVGEDIGELTGIDSLEIPVSNNLVMVLGSLSQSYPTGVVVDFSEASNVLENVRQATAFGMRSVVAVPDVEIDIVSQLSIFCEKASMVRCGESSEAILFFRLVYQQELLQGCIIAPTLSIGAVLLQEAAIAASYHYSHVDIVESQHTSKEKYPSPEALRVAKSLSGLGRVYNDSDFSKEHPARGEVVDDGVRIHSMVSPGVLSSMSVNLAGPGEVFSLRHDITDLKALMPGLLVAIRRVVRLKSLVYGLEKVL